MKRGTASAVMLIRFLTLVFYIASGATASAAGRIAPLSGFKHDRWPLERGAPSRINSIAQSSDGFLWIGGVEGLLRFDGVTFERVAFAKPGSARLVVSQVKGSRSGDVWVGLARGRGVAVWRHGRLIDARMPNPSREVTDIEEDAEGAIWIARGGRSLNTLARYAAGRWQEFGTEAGLPTQPVWDIHFARDGTQWVVTSTTLVIRRPGSASFEDTGIAVSPRASIAEDPQGRIWLADVGGTRALERYGEAVRPGKRRYPHPDVVGGTRILFDRNGDLWETTWNSGILRIRLPAAADDGADPLSRITHFNATTGLTSDQARALFQDREGNIWVGTELGLDRLRPARVAIEAGIEANSPSSYRLAAAKDGIVYVADASHLYRVAPQAQPARILNLRTPAEALCADWKAGVWLISADQVFHVRDTMARAFAKPNGVTALGCAHDSKGRLWLPGLDRGLFWLEAGRWRRWPGLNADVGLPANAAVDSAGRAVIVFRATPPQRRDAPFLSLFDARSPVGGIEGLLPTRSSLLISGSRGLAAPFEPGTPRFLVSHHPWAASLNGMVETSRGDTWAIGDEGIIRLRTADLRRALRSPDSPVPFQLFDFRDGLNSFVQKAPGAQVVEGGDGRLWFLTRRNVVRIDPAALSINRLPPDVVITALAAGGHVYQPSSRLDLPGGTTSVELAYTATSLTVPERVRFRYRLIGLDPRWVDAGTRRRVVFHDLAPGTYEFQVIAANEDGIWNREGGSAKFKIPKLFYQTVWFKALAAIAILAILYLIYIARINYLRRLIHDRLAERMLERERIARELHDTLIQAVQGLIMRFQSVADTFANDARTQAVLVPALDRAEEILVEGRDRLKGLRGLDERHLLSELDRLAKGQAFDTNTTIFVMSKGIARNIAPDIVEDVIGIVSEAIYNAARHASGTEVEVHVEYKRRGVNVTVKDNGVGIPPEILSGGGRAGHYGLLGMRERAARIGAKFTIESPGGSGTLVQVCIPGRVAYFQRRSV